MTLALRARLLGVLLAAALGATAAQAGTLRYCDKQPRLSAGQQDVLLRFAAVVRARLAASGQRLAVVARSGLDLQRFDQRYSHAGLALLDSADTPWSVRQLYFDCDAQRPRLFDQGLAGFVLGTDDPTLGFVSVLLLPPDAADALAALALDNPQALLWLAADYSANAYAFATRYQNCNQWVLELMAAAWAPLGRQPSAAGDDDGPARRARAQQWLRNEGFEPSRFEVGWRPLMALATALVPYLHSDDHPAADLAQARYRVTTPASIEAWLRQRWPALQRLEFCHAGARVVVRRDGPPLADDCKPSAGDEVIALD